MKQWKKNIRNSLDTFPIEPDWGSTLSQEDKTKWPYVVERELDQRDIDQKVETLKLNLERNAGEFERTPSPDKDNKRKKMKMFVIVCMGAISIVKELHKAVKLQIYHFTSHDTRPTGPYNEKGSATYAMSTDDGNGLINHIGTLNEDNQGEKQAAIDNLRGKRTTVRASIADVQAMEEKNDQNRSAFTKDIPRTSQ